MTCPLPFLPRSQEVHSLQQQCSQLEEGAAAAQEAAGQQRAACVAAVEAKGTAAEAMHAAVQAHAAAAAECSAQERQLRQLQDECEAAAAAEAGARAAAHAASEQLAVATMGVQRWSKTVEGVAKELAACHRTQQAPFLVRLKEARQRLEQHRQEAAAAGQQLPQLQAAARAAAQQAQQAETAVLEAQQRLVAAAEDRARLKQHLDVAIGRHEAAAVTAVAAEHAASAAEQQQRLLAAQQQAAVGRLRQAAQQVVHRQQAATQLQRGVEVLQTRHREAIADMLAAGQQQQRRGKLKRRLEVVQELGEAGDALPSPTAVQQRRPPPAQTAAMLPGKSALAQAAAGQAPVADAPAAEEAAVREAAGAVVVPEAPCAPWDGWSCSSSELGSPQSEAAAASPPLTGATLCGAELAGRGGARACIVVSYHRLGHTNMPAASVLSPAVDEAAARFHMHCLLRRVLHTLRLEAAATRAAMQAAAERCRQRQLAAVVHAWRHYAVEAADWLATASLRLRRRWLLRQWHAAAVARRWQQQAEGAADAFARRRMLLTGVAAWRQCVQHERWRDGVHEAVVCMRMRSMLGCWRAWALQRRVKAARQRAALAVYERRLLVAPLRQWRWVQRSKALLLRVFGTAVELWQDEVRQAGGAMLPPALAASRRSP